MSDDGPAAGALELRLCGVEEILALRHQVLRAPRPLASARFEGDEAAATRHYGAFVDGRAVGCVSLMASTWEGEPAWQLRGMATAPEVRGQGVGRRLLALAEGDAAAHGPRLLWCNARLSAVDFYRRGEWTVASEVFEVPDVGPHRRMFKRIV